MRTSSDSRRRRLGIVCLAVPCLMLLLGQTLLKSSMDGMVFIVYWLVCFGFTIAAVVVALVDLRAVQRQTREETRDLLEETLGEAPPTPNKESGSRF